MKDCSDCKYEPDWGKEVGAYYPRRTGACKWELTHALPKMPSGYFVTRNHITKYRDGSGIPTNCKTWEPNANVTGLAPAYLLGENDGLD